MVRFLLTSMLVLATTQPALAQPADTGAGEDLLGESMTTVVVVPDEGAILVTHAYRFTNSTTDETFTGFFETLPWDATDVMATSGGEELPLVATPARNGFSEWFVRFAQPLTPTDEQHVELTWRQDGLTSEPNDLAHVSQHLVAIAPYAVEHRAVSQLRIEIPGQFEVVEVGDLVVAQEADRLVLQTPENDRATGYVAVPIVLEAPDRFSRSPVPGSSGDITIATIDPLSSWLKDDLGVLLDGLRAVVPLDVPGSIEFRQGYTGGAPTRTADDGAIVLPFGTEGVIAGREYAAAWLASIDFEDDALRVALASALADDVAARANLPVSGRSGAWTSAMDALVSLSDDRTMSTVLSALDAGVPAYAGVGDEFSDAPVDWRRLTDVFQHIGGVPATPAAMRLSATIDQSNELAQRDVALVDYDALAERAAPWSMPPLLRDAMTAWDFDEMAVRQRSVSDVVIARDEMIGAAESVGLEIGPHVQDEFERARLGTDEVWSRLAEQRKALDMVAEALRLDVGDRGLLSSLGMWGLDADATLVGIVDAWNSGDFDAAAHDAEELIEAYEVSVGRGTLRLVAPLTLCLFVVTGVQTIRHRWRIRHATTQL